MKRKTGLFVVLIVAVVSALLFTSCDALIKALTYSVSGRVVNVKAPASGTFYISSKNSALSLVGTTVTLTSNVDSSKTYTSTVGSSGTYAIGSVDNGSYTITCSQSGWTFVPTTIDVTGALQSAPDLIAFPTTEAGTLTAVMTWTNKNYDMDLHMTWGTLAAAGATVPDLRHLYYTTQTITGTGFSATLDRDVTGALLTSSPLVETITLTTQSGGPIPGDPFYNTADGSTQANSFRFYVDSFNSTVGTNNQQATGSLPGTSPAGVKVDFFQGTTHLGTFAVPYDTGEQTLRIARVQFSGTAANSYFVYTDLESTTANTFRGFSTPNIGIPSAIR